MWGFSSKVEIVDNIQWTKQLTVMAVVGASVDVVDVEELPFRLVANADRRLINEGVSRAVNGMTLLAPYLLIVQELTIS